MDCPDEYVATLNARHCKFYKHFGTDFYQYFYKPADIASTQPYIRLLSVEYTEVLQRYKSFNQPVLFWFHTLNWQHAYALALALEGFKNTELTKAPIVVGLMYNPYNSQNIVGSNGANVALNFELAFKYLNKFKNVQLYAADGELAAVYSKILSQPLDVHPCILLGSKPAQKQPSAGENRRVILFSGDAKLDKGFGDLPKIAKSLVVNPAFSDVEFVVQYTVTNNSAVLSAIDSRLKQLAAEHSRLTIVDQFMSHDELHKLFSRSHAVLFNYAEHAYKNQSSGVLWLAAQHKLTVISMSNVWLNREAKRLGLKLYEANEQTLHGQLLLVLQQVNAVLNSEPNGTNGYSEALFQDLGDWLFTNYQKPANNQMNINVCIK
ncbi:hypothetical protein [Reinekea marinisedimentorum]|nr:hypothetical protein [Reinekea marinisedimentorum]